MERIEHGDRFGEFVADRVRVTTERVQGRSFDAGREVRALVGEPSGVGLTRPARNEIQQPCMNHAVRVAGVVHDAGDHARTRWSGVSPDVLIDTESVDSGQAVGGSGAADRLGCDRVPERVPGHPELIG